MRPRVIVIANGDREIDVLRALAREPPLDADFAVHLRIGPAKGPPLDVGRDVASERARLVAEITFDTAVSITRVVLGAPTFASVSARTFRTTALDGIHLGGALRSELVAARAELGPDVWISVPAHTDEDVAAAAREGATAVYVSPIFATPGKGAPRGLDALRRARELAGAMHVYALGGVDATNAASCIAAGADGVALIRAFFDADSPRESLLAVDAAVRRAALERRV